MKINRQALATHLHRISCGGLIPDVAFSGAFEATAMPKDQLLCVFAPGLSKIEPLPVEVGIGSLDRLVKALGLLSGSGSEGSEVTIDIEDFRLVIEEEHRGTLRLLTAAPSTIGTRLNPETRDKLLAGAPKGEGISLGQTLIEGVCSTFRAFRAEEVAIQVGKKGGKIVVGNENADIGEFDFRVSSEEEYSLLFGKHLIEVFSVIQNFEKATLHLGGINSMVLIKDGEYQYVLSPRTRGAE